MKETQEIKIVTADPSGLGLFGLAVITLVASSQKLKGYLLYYHGQYFWGH